MYNVFNTIKSRFAVFSAVFITVITTKVKGYADNCIPEQLMNCAKPLSVLTDSGLTFVSNKAELDKICPDLKDAIKCIHGFSRRCMNQDHRKHFKKLFHGTGSMVHELCKNGTYQEEYLRHAPCMKQVESENEICFKRYTKAMHEIQSISPEINPTQPDVVSVFKRKREAADEGIKNVCCAFQDFVECSTHSVRRKCGGDSAEFSRKFLDKMSSSMLQLHCKEYGMHECGLASSSPTNIAQSLLLAFALTILALVSR